ncbi:MAG: trypsin-like peptidase domain-containing protein [Clostridia bacterium]|nr:trypsin-like peptidase domain-containing protein [Clostridia bacterium]
MTGNNENNYQNYGGAPSFVPAKYNRSRRTNAIIAVFAALCVLCGGLGFFFGARYASAPEKGKNGNETSITVSSHNGHSSDDTDNRTEESGGNVSYTLETVDPNEYYTVKSVVKLTINSVVEITTETVSTGAFMNQYVTTGAGSGVIITEDGYIVTNDHVVAGASSIKVRLHDGTECTASLVGTDSQTDVAVIKIDKTGLSAAVLGDPDALEVGDPVVAIGNPLGTLGGTVTEGIISALERDVSIDGKYMTLLQHSAPVNPGNSGGGLFNASGQLIGIVNAKYSDTSYEGLGFAIPLTTALPVVRDLMEYGYVRGRISLGASTVDITSQYYAMYYGVPEYGIYVQSVSAGSDAANAGMRSGDRIVSMDGREISSSEDVDAVVKSHTVGDKITVVLKRYTRSGRTYTAEDIELEIEFTEYKPN